MHAYNCSKWSQRWLIPVYFSGPLFRAQLYTGDSSSFFVLSAHTLVADVPSMLVLLDDLRVLYSYNLSAAKAERTRKSVATVLLDDGDMSDAEGQWKAVRVRSICAMPVYRCASEGLEIWVSDGAKA